MIFKLLSAKNRLLLLESVLPFLSIERSIKLICDKLFATMFERYKTFLP